MSQLSLQPFPPGWKHGPLLKPGLSLPSFPSVTRDSAPESQPVIWVSSWWQEMLTKMKADQPLLLKVNFRLSFQNHLGGGGDGAREREQHQEGKHALGFYLAA